MSTVIAARLGSSPRIAPLTIRDPERSASPESALVQAAQKGSTEAFGELVQLHQRRAYAVARAIVGSHEDAEDVVQEAFLHAFRALDRFITGQPFGAWVNRIVANAAFDLTRRRKVRAVEELPATLANPFFDPGEQDELRTRLSQAINDLSERQRTVVLLHDVEGFQHAEIGALLGIPEGTCRSDLHHARSSLRHALRNLRGER